MPPPCQVSPRSVLLNAVENANFQSQVLHPPALPAFPFQFCVSSTETPIKINTLIRGAHGLH